MRLEIARGVPRTGLFIVLLAAALGSSGCLRYYWYKPGLTAQELAGDDAACRRAAAGPADADGEAKRSYGQCMRDRGYDLLRKKTIEQMRNGKAPSLSS